MILTDADHAVRPGPKNALTDVAGLAVGNAQDPSIRSGVTVVHCVEGSAVTAVDIRGGGPGTRETDAIGLGRLVKTADAIVLSGGSAFGLEAAGGLQNWLAQRGQGFNTGAACVPIVPTAILYDLANGGDKSFTTASPLDSSPFRRLGVEAIETASDHFETGTSGAGYGARAGALQGGLGTASAFDPATGATIAALVAVNSFGDVTGPDGRFFSASIEQDGEFGGFGPSAEPLSLEPQFPKLQRQKGVGTASMNTTLAVVATDSDLDHGDAHRIAVMAQAGCARAIRPIFTPFDGDTIFSVATGKTPKPDAVGVTRIGSIAADCLARAVAIGVFSARTVDASWPSWRDRYPEFNATR
ncbi:MAG: P1 family peptidase [Pseudomonadota bacterium]